MMVRQLSLEFPTRSASGAEDFWVARCNEDAVARIDAWPDWPDPILALCGPAGSGKSHLVHVWASQSGGEIRTAAELSDATIPENPLLAVEDVEQGVDEKALFHLLNWTRERKGSLLLTGRMPPARWPVRLPDLRSRLAAIPVAAIDQPDDETFAAVLLKMLMDRQLSPGEGVIKYLVTRSERSFEAARAIAAALDRESLAQKRPITIPLAKEVLAAISETE